MAARHLIGYSKSTRAKCHAPTPCQSTSLPPGTLRYGQATTTDYGENVEWRHWGCVTPQILSQLAQIPLDSADGYNELKPSDQQKIQSAITRLRVDPVDIPKSAHPPRTAFASGSSSQLRTTNSVQTSQKRTAQDAQFGFTQEPEPEPTQDENNSLATVPDELFCTFRTSVVGIRYYNGLVGNGEAVRVVREPANKYDRNAIRILNIRDVQVGHLSRSVAADLAPLLDQSAVIVDGVILEGNLNSSAALFDLPISLKIYGPADKRAILEPRLLWATPGRRGFGSSRPAAAVTVAPLPRTQVMAKIPTPSQANPLDIETSRRQAEALQKQAEAIRKAHELREMLSNLQKVDDQGRRSSLLDTLCSAEDTFNLPVYSNPPGIASGQLTVDLLKHQLQALQWCIERENPTLPTKETDKPVQFWQLRKGGGKTYYYNLATKTPQKEGPSFGRGALCADAMGLGKTLTMLSLVLATKEQQDSGFSNATLIVAPLSVLSNWQKQIEDHCTEGALSYYIYYGSKRGGSSGDLSMYDVVITTYQTVTGEWNDAGPPNGKKRKTERALFEVKWKRVILDEGHTIRNPKTQNAKACTALTASRRWVLSGTPIINSPQDLGSILTFLRICQPLDNPDFFSRLLLRPITCGDPSGSELLKALMTQICLRRTKEMQDNDGKSLITLPPVEIIRIPVTIHEAARALYDQLEQMSQQRVAEMISNTGNIMIQSNVLSLLTRLRQIALHPGLVPVNYIEELRKSAESAAGQPQSIGAEEKLTLQNLLRDMIEDSEECPICLSRLSANARITSCSHAFCLPCITETLTRDPKCPMDRRPLKMGDLYEPPPPTDLTQRPNPTTRQEPTCEGPSAKIDQLLQMLRLIPGGDKALVFSQFTGFLDKVEDALVTARIPYVRFDGKMSARSREEAIRRFSVPLHEKEALPTQPAKANEKDTDSDSDSDFEPDFTSTQKKTRSPSHSINDSKTNPRVMLLSLKAGALGLNLTVANHVFLMDPWWQESIESQAVDRVNRIGQKKKVRVYQLIAENTVESKVLDIQQRKKEMIQQAFSGTMTRPENPHQRREARLQELIELFGMNRGAEAN